MVDALKDNGEGVEEGKKHREDEAGVKADEEDYRFDEEHPDRREKRDRDQNLDSR